LPPQLGQTTPSAQRRATRYSRQLSGWRSRGSLLEVWSVPRIKYDGTDGVVSYIIAQGLATTGFL
jgi:hypothetical protein